MDEYSSRDEGGADYSGSVCVWHIEEVHQVLIEATVPSMTLAAIVWGNCGAREF